MPTPSQNVSFNWSRSMPSDRARRKSALVSHLRISGSAVKLWIHVEHEVGSGKAEIQMNLVVALLLVIEQHRQLAEVDVTFLLVVFPGHRAKVDDLEVLRKRELDAVEIGQLVAGRIDGIVVRVAFQQPDRGVDRSHGAPRPENRHVGIEFPVLLEVQHLHPVLESLLLRACVDRLDRRVFRQELLEVMAGRIGAEAELRGLTHGLSAAHRRVAGHDVLEQVIRHVEFPAHRGFIHLDHAAGLSLRTHFRCRRRHDLGIAVDVLEPEDEIVGGVRRAVGPLHALAQEQRVGLAVVAEFVTLGDAGHDLAAVRAPVAAACRTTGCGCRSRRRAGPVNARRQVPPYLPISFSGCQTIGSAGMRCSTGGSLPAFTSSASIGASANCLRPLRRVGDHRRTLDFAHQAGLRRGWSALPRWRRAGIPWPPDWRQGRTVRRDVIVRPWA